jgi:cytidylate kinase
MQELNHSTYESALELVRREDLGRARYLRKYFRKDINDPLLYHLIINTDLVSFDEAATMITQAVEKETVPAQAKAA